MTEQFCIVQFSPSPECLGHVNVALLVTGAWNRFVCNPRFPQLRRIAPGYDLEQMTNTFICASASVMNMTADGARCFLPDHSGQFKLTAPIPLHSAWTEQTEKKLVATLLGTDSHPVANRAAAPKPNANLITKWRNRAARVWSGDAAITLVECADELEEATKWHPHTERPEPGEYLVALKSGKMQTAKWELTKYEPAGEWIDEDGDSLEDCDGQVVTHWRVRPTGPGEVG